MLKCLSYIKGRLNERSTWMFWFGSIGAAAAMAAPFNWIACAMLLIAGLVPDGEMVVKQTAVTTETTTTPQ